MHWCAKILLVGVVESFSIRRFQKDPQLFKEELESDSQKMHLQDGS